MYYKILTNKYNKLFLSFGIFIYTIYNIYYYNIYINILLILLSIIILFLFFKNEFLILTFFHFRKSNIKYMQYYLSYIIYPDLQLIKNQIGYFYFLKGLTIINYDINTAERYLRLSLKKGLNFRYNCAIAKLNLATILASKGKKEEAEFLLLEVKKLDKAKIMEEQIKIIKEKIKKTNYMNHNSFFRKKKFSIKSYKL